MGLGTTGLKTLRRGRFQTGLQGAKGRKTPQRRAPRLWPHAGVGGVEHEWLLAEAGRAMGEGTEASLRWRKIRVITDS